MTDDEYHAERKRQIEEFRTRINAAIEDAQHSESSEPIWKTIQDQGHEHVVDFSDVKRAIDVARGLERVASACPVCGHAAHPAKDCNHGWSPHPTVLAPYGMREDEPGSGCDCGLYAEGTAERIKGGPK